MELFDLSIIVHVREVLLLEIILKLLPHNIYVIGLHHLPEVLPPYRCSSIQIEYGYPCLHISRVVLDLKILSYPKTPSFNFLTRFYLTIKCRRLCLLKFPIWIVLVIPLPLSPVRWRAWNPNGFFRVWVLSLGTLLELLVLLWEFLLELFTLPSRLVVWCP